MTEQWQELKETIIELRDNDGTGTQQEVCKFLVNLMDLLEKQMQQPCEDAISRQAAIDAMAKIEQDDIDQYGCKIPEGFDSSPAIEALNGLPPVTPQLEKIHVANIHFDEEKFEKIMKNTPLTILDDSNTPTIQLIQPKTGHWITNFHGFPSEPTSVCSECGFDRDFYIRIKGFNKIKYCPNCGAKMIESE